MIQIREMQVRDTDAVAEIERQIFSQPWSRQGFLDAVNLGNTVFLVAEENNRIIGYIGMYLAMDEGEITNVAVAPVERRHGVGGMLLTELLKLQKTKASQELFWKYVHQMTVPSGCMNAMGLYSVVCAKDFMNFQKRMPM